MKFLYISLVLFSINSYSKGCDISGYEMLWAYDYCFAEHETDDSIHPGVIQCVENAQIKINAIGSCPSKKYFKSKICKLRQQYNNIDYSTCMSIDKPLGNAVRDGGI